MGAARMLVTAAREGQSPTQSVRWRLIGANSRPLAHSFDAFDDVSSCLANVLGLRSLQGGARVRVVGGPGAWSWQLEAGAAPQAAAARTYLRRCEAQASAELFLSLLPQALATAPQVRPARPASRLVGAPLGRSASRLPAVRRGG